MPHVFALVIAGAGLYAGYKWVSRQVAQMQDAVRRQEADLRDAVARGRGAPKDLGTLELDPKSGVYRPRAK
ncbi:hypothetical protein [Hyphomicrobium sp. LHD-15]|jgi:hypothetical protein|uniref:hypothetical protein n=1 Tax=Hyphomicrobium sp. LHD-15 TaxID=3072142 RepID=UPI0028109340|nr:hypothetical protein [Hyphomicrobium sp. LHD-15]MDQ8699394.1 hypothetical protein [Hyphomicrobium sp. LHD-15]